MKASLYAIPSIMAQLQDKKHTEIFVPPSEEDYPEIANEVFRRVCLLFKADPIEVKKNNKVRKHKYLKVRQLTVAILKKNYGFSYRESAEIFLQNHATALNSVRKIDDYIKFDKDFKKKYGYIFQ